jgi:MoxR-like ATPase
MTCQTNIKEKTMMTLKQRAEQLNASNSKDELLSLARFHAWKGDPERAYTLTTTGEPIHQKATADIEIAKNANVLATGKSALAYYVARRLNDLDEQATERNGEAEQPTEPTPTPTEQPTKEQTAMTPTAAPTDKAAQLAELIASMTAPQQATLDPEQVRKIVLQELNNQAPKLIEIKTDTTRREVSGVQHPLYEKVLRLVAGGVNVMLTGAAGSGKTHLAEQVATALGRTYGAIHCTSGASESQLMGWLLPSDGGKFEYQAAPFVDLYENGNSLFLFDEIDAADPNFLLVANGALANGHLHIAQRRQNPTAKRGENVGIMATANTFGSGADMIYAGRNQLDGATLDRWYMVQIDYMANFEAAIMGAELAEVKTWKPASDDSAKTAADLITLHEWIKNLREKATAAKLRRIVSTRSFIKAKQAREAGIPVSEIKADLLAGWSRDELAKVGA